MLEIRAKTYHSKEFVLHVKLVLTPQKHQGYFIFEAKTD